MQVRRVHDVVPFKRRLGQMPRDLHGDSPWNPGSDQIPDTAPAEVVKEQSLVLPNSRARLHSQSYLNACSLKRLPQISCIEKSSLTRQFLESFIELKRQGQQNRLLILGLVPLDPKLESSLFGLYLMSLARRAGKLPQAPYFPMLKEDNVRKGPPDGSSTVEPSLGFSIRDSHIH